MHLIYRHLKAKSLKHPPLYWKLKCLAFPSSALRKKILEDCWKYWIWLQEGNELANKKCFSHHYAQRFLLAPKRGESQGGGGWKFIFGMEFPLEYFRAPATGEKPEDDSNDWRKEWRFSLHKKQLSLFTFPMNLNWIDRDFARNERRIFNGKRWFSTDERKWDINQSIFCCRFRCISRIQTLAFGGGLWTMWWYFG